MENKESKVWDVTLICIFTLSIFFFARNSCGAEKSAKNNNWLETEISVQCQDCVVQDILQKVSVKLGIKIVYDASLAQVPMSCNYTSVTVEKIIDRIFRNYNKGVTLEPDTNTMIIQTFGAYGYIIAAADKNGDPVNMPYLGEMVNEELIQLHKKQYAEYQKELSDGNAIVPGLGISRSKLKEIQTRQYREYKEQLNNPNAIVPELGITRKALNDLHRKQNKEYRDALKAGTIKSDGL